MSRMTTVLRLLSQGRSLKEIATELSMRQEAVEAIIDHLIREDCISSVQCGGCGFCTGGCSCSSEQRMFALTLKGERMRSAE
jgi:heterodisulfide reductase subunit C